MQVPRILIAATLLGALAAACGGTAPTQGPGGPGATSNTGGQATQNPGPGQTQTGGTDGNGGGESGSVKFTVSGPFDKTEEFPFVPAGSIFGTAQGSVLNFSKGDDSSALLSILIAADGVVVVSYTSADGQVPGATCTTTDLKIEARNASGKFDCTSTASMSGSGAVLGPATIKGEFTARA
jgi:hypothetical protein